MLIVKAIKQSRYHGVSNAKIALINEKIKKYSFVYFYRQMFCWGFIMVNHSVCQVNLV